MIGLGRLLGFVWVGRHRSFARAAREFPYPISQPGLFQQVQKLEDELGFSLFHRTAKDRMELTAAGRALYEEVAPFLGRLEELVGQLRAGNCGILRIEASALVLRQLVPLWMRELRASDASMEIRVAETDAADASRILTGQTDLVVDFLPADLPKAIESRVIGFAHGYLVVPATRSRKRLVRLETVEHDEFIAYPTGTPHRALQDTALRDAGLAPRRITEVGTADSMVALAAAGLGFTLVPWIASEGPRTAGTWAFRQERMDAVFPIRCAWSRSAAAEPTIVAALAAAPNPNGA